jgi:hypothetical protein
MSWFGGALPASPAKDSSPPLHLQGLTYDLMALWEVRSTIGGGDGWVWELANWMLAQVDGVGSIHPVLLSLAKIRVTCKYEGSGLILGCIKQQLIT